MTDESKGKCSGCSGLMWWTTLTVAVMAVPVFGFILASASRLGGLGAMVVFVLACWLCTYLGMKLMHMPHMSEKIGSHKK